MLSSALVQCIPTGGDRSRADRAENELVLDILSYFMRNQSAVDTVEGITRWRLLDQRIHRTVHEVLEALTVLVDLDLLTQTRRSGSSALIGFNKEQADAARRFLAREGTDGESD